MVMGLYEDDGRGVWQIVEILYQCDHEYSIEVCVPLEVLGSLILQPS